MADPYAPMNIFNNRPFNECYAWDKADILTFLADVAANPQTYGVTNPSVKQDLVELNTKIAGLTNFTDAQSLYNVPAPPQQVLRQGKKPNFTLNPTGPIHWSANDNQVPFYVIYDLLGAFLSPITTITTQLQPIDIAKRYFLALVVLYAKWCRVLSPGPEIKTLRPTVVQVTWFKKDQTLYPFFGASLAGYLKEFTAFVKIVQETRYNYLKSAGMLPDEYTQSYNDSPKRGIGKGDGKGGTRYGNCGETYPFLYVLRDQEALIKNSYGMAAELGPLFQGNRFTVYDGKACWETQQNVRPSLLGPCDNCESLLAKCKVPVGNYTLFYPAPPV